MQAPLCSPQVLSLSQTGAEVQVYASDAPSYQDIAEAKNKAVAECGSSTVIQCPCPESDGNQRGVPEQTVKH